MAKKRLNPAIKRSRTRSGCLTCRDRHMKCDEQQPVCKNCIKSKRKCFRGIRLNFTQYTIYNPETVAPVTQDLKFLDQSITIASLYENGKRLYEPYLHLHLPEDLRESDLQYQHDIYSSAPSVPISRDFNFFNLDNNTILENFDITNFLLNKNTYDETSLPSRSLSTMTVESQISPTAQDFTYNIDTQMFINLIENEKYYWVLDLFNELSMWKSVIPQHCLKESENGDNFLINCLFSCSLKSKIDLSQLVNEQLSLWNKVKNSEVNFENIKIFEKLYISIVLLLLNFKIKISRSLIKFDASSKNILNNQVKLFNKLILKFDESSIEKFKSVILVSSIHSIVILKFFIIKQIESKALEGFDMHYDIYNLGEVMGTNDVSDEEIVYNDCNSLDKLFGMNKFEILNLNQHFNRLDFPQLKYNLESGINIKSDSLKLRESIWHLIKMFYLKMYPNTKQIELNNNIFMDVIDDFNFDYQGVDLKGPKYNQVIVPTQRGFAINLIREFINKLQGINDTEVVNISNAKIKQIFKMINDSMMENDVKLLWENNFKWTLLDIRN